MVAAIGKMIEVNGARIKVEAVELVRHGYRRIYAKLEEARNRGTAREVTRLADIVRSTGTVAMPPLLTNDERLRFEELTNTYLGDRLAHMVRDILKYDLRESTMGPAIMPVRDDEGFETEVRLVPWW